MFKIVINKERVAVVVTDNPAIADAIREEGNGDPVFFTGAPNLKVAKGLAVGLTKEFGISAVVFRGGHCKFHVRFFDHACPSVKSRSAIAVG